MGNIYISYSQDNKEIAKKIRDALETWGHTVWMDDPNEMFDRSLAEQLDRALAESQVFVALLSPSSARSRTARREIALAKSLDKFILPVLVEPMPSVTEKGGGKYIDATTNPQAAISRIVKIVNDRTQSLPTSPPIPPSRPETEAEDEPEPAPDRLNPVVLGIIVLAIILGIVLVILSLAQPPERTSTVDAVNATLTQVQAAANAQATSNAIIQSTANAQATTIAELQQTQDTVNLQLTQLAAATDTLVPVTTEATISPSPGPEEPSPTPTTQVSPAPITPSITPSPGDNLTTTNIPADDATPTRETFNASPTSTASLPTVGPAPTIDLTQAQAHNLLTNPGFESFVIYNTNESTAQGWTPWFITGGNAPSYQLSPVYGSTAPNTTRIRTGINAQKLTSQFATHDGGLYQQIAGITPGKTVRFSVYAYVWSSTFNDLNRSEQPGGVQVRIGIDPTGGTDPQGENVIWSTAVERYDAYNELSITGTATSNVVTVFIRSQIDFPVQNNVVYLDDALFFVANP